jgi:hypothetical protein
MIDEEKYQEVKDLICHMINNAMSHFHDHKIIDILHYLKTQIEELDIEDL